MHKRSGASAGHENRVRRIAVAISEDRHNRLILDGLFRFARKRPNWMIRTGAISAEELRAAPFDVLAGMFQTAQDRAPYEGLGIPLLSVLRTPEDGAFSSVVVDDLSVGRMAAEHFGACGLRHVSFVGNPLAQGQVSKADATAPATRWTSEFLRRAGFTEAAKARGLSVSTAPDYYPWDDSQCRGLTTWLRSLPKPNGMFCVTDAAAQLMFGFCRRANLGIPAPISILGVDNETDICELTNPPLSSIVIPWERIGEELGGLIDGVFRKAPSKARPVKVDPLGVVVRGSTVRQPEADPIVARAMEILRRRAFEQTNLKEMFESFPFSLRHLTRQFNAVTGRTLLQELCRIRVERARELLVSTTDPLLEIARASGFSSRRQQERVFKRMIGKSPGDYRTGFGGAAE